MNHELEALKAKLQDLTLLHNLAALLDWDQQINLPPKAAVNRGEQAALVGRLAHEAFTSNAFADLLAAAETAAGQNDGTAGADDCALLKLIRRKFDREKRVPVDYVERFAAAASEAHAAWEAARRRSDFAMFRPHLEMIFQLRREYAQFFAPYSHIYDPLLADFESGIDTALVQRIFARLRPRQTELIAAAAAHRVDTAFLQGPFSRDGQLAMSKLAADTLGFDWARGRLDESEHPFTTELGRDDVRITTKIYADNLSCLWSVLHETGHALYGQAALAAFGNNPLGTVDSLTLHESQSRLWENLVGRSKPFLEFLFPKLQQIFPEALDAVSGEMFYRAVNQVKPGLIRVDADEATYNLHIMLRFELEVAVLTGEAEVAELPALWNEKMRHYLGVQVPDDAHGVLQDVHWAGGAIGYFPTYALGNLFSVLCFNALCREIPDVEAALRAGDCSGIRRWLTERLYREGARRTAPEMIRRITGGELEPEPYLEYLQKKFVP